MNKKKIFNMIIISFCFNTCTAFGAQDGLDINSEYFKINNKSQIYTSITDMYKVPLFTDETIAKKEKLQNEEKEKLRYLEENIFLNHDDEKDSETVLTEKVSAYRLFEKPHTESKIKYKDNDAGFKFISVITIMALSILTGILTTKYYKYKRKKDAGSIEYNSYTGF